MKGQPTTASGKPIGDNGIVEDEQPALPDEGSIALTGDAGAAEPTTKADELADAVADDGDVADRIVAESQRALVAQRDELVAGMERDAAVKKEAQERINKARPKIANLNRVINSFEGRTSKKAAK